MRAADQLDRALGCLAKVDAELTEVLSEVPAVAQEPLRFIRSELRVVARRLANFRRGLFGMPDDVPPAA